MFRTKFYFIFFLTIITINICPNFEGRFMRYPDIFKDKIVFTYENDLWLVSSSDGKAIRITNAPGTEYSAKFSPDGKWIAFTGGYDGSQNVYLIPSEGGEPKRLTFNPGGGQSIAWTKNGKEIIYRSMWENFIGRDPNLYSVGIDGTVPEQLPIDRGVLCSFNHDGSKMIYCRKGSEEYYWKRYKGGRYQDIWLYDFTNKKFTPISNYVGKNSYPMWIENKMYFVSDKTNGISNLYVQDLTTNEIKQLTFYNDFDVMMPDYDDNQIIFIQNGFINVFDLKTNKTKKVVVFINSDRWQLRDKTINTKEYIHHFNLANDGKKVILEARGDVFSVPTEKEISQNLSNTSKTREMYPQISPDGKMIAFFSDLSGEYQLYIQSIDGGEWKQLTKELDRTIYQIDWSPDGKKILFGNKDYAIFYIDIDTKNLTKVDESKQMKNDEFYWQISDYSWSPDSKWICYSLVQFNRNSQIFIYNLEQKKKYSVTSDFYDNLNPSFDANGKYLYYLSSRNFDLNMDFYEDNHIIKKPYQIIVVQLQDKTRPPFLDATSKHEIKESEQFKIDLDGIQNRTYPLPISSGNYFYLKAGKNKVAFCSVESFTEAEYDEIFKPRGDNKWELHIFDMNDKKEIILTDKIKEFNTSHNKERLAISKGNDIFITTFEQAYKTKSIGEKIDLNSLTYTINYRNEWNQIFNDCWRWYRDFFYDKNMHGHNWKELGDKYRAYIPDISSREELNWVMLQMVGELCVSHTYIGGGDVGTSTTETNPVFTGWLGADLIKDSKTNYYVFKKIYGPTDINLNLASPLSRPDIDIKEGDFLISINGLEIKYPEDYHKHLQVTQGKKISITVNNKPSKQDSKTYEIELIKNNPQLRYFRWLTDNVNKVLTATNGKVGYMHINAMGAGGIGEFDKFWRAFRYKEGFVIDVRRNSGGWTEYFMIDKLERKMVAHNVLRDMAPFRYPGSIGNGNYIAISNEYNGSDGEAFIEHFKARNLGDVVGVPSWGGLVGILNGQTTIDNGNIQQSNNAFYDKNGKWLVENHGADPTILIDNDPQSVMEGKDLQLEKAIESILEKIKKNPFNFPPVPEYPIR